MKEDEMLVTDPTDELLKDALDRPVALDTPPAWEEIERRAGRGVVRARRRAGRRRLTMGLALAAALAVLSATATAAIFLFSGTPHPAAPVLGPNQRDQALVLAYSVWSTTLGMDERGYWTQGPVLSDPPTRNANRAPRIKAQRDGLRGAAAVRKLKFGSARGKQLRSASIQAFTLFALAAKEDLAFIDATRNHDAAGAKLHKGRWAVYDGEWYGADRQAHDLALAIG